MSLLCRIHETSPLGEKVKRKSPGVKHISYQAEGQAASLPAEAGSFGYVPRPVFQIFIMGFDFQMPPAESSRTTLQNVQVSAANSAHSGSNLPRSRAVLRVESGAGRIETKAVSVRLTT
jgi:hypothetical protein